MFLLNLANFLLFWFQEDGGSGAGAAAVGAAFGLVFLLFSFVMACVLIAAMWKIFVKAGEPGWAAIVPILNIITLLKIVDRPIWWIVLFVIPFVNVIASILLTFELAKKFGQGVGFTIGMLVLPFVFFPILGFGSAQYRR